MQAVAALAVAVVAMGEDTGSEMCTRIFGQLVCYFFLHNIYKLKNMKIILSLGYYN